MVDIIAIVGGGQAAVSCASQLRSSGFDGQVCMVCEEASYPYQRPPLSKKFLTGNIPEERLLLKQRDYYESNNIKVFLSDKATGLDRKKKLVYLRSGKKINYTKLLIATGSRATKKPFAMGGVYSNVLYLRDLCDAKKLRDFLAPEKKILVVGGGYLGLEVASVCTAVGMNTSIVEGSDRILKRVAGEPTATHLRKIILNRGVNIFENDSVIKINSTEGTVKSVVLASQKTIDIDLLFIATGSYPEVELAKNANLSIKNGVKVNEMLETDDPSIYAAGDCASFLRDGKPLRLESVGNAIDQGKTVALNIMGEEKIFEAKPWFWTEQFDQKLQIAGLCNDFSDIVERKFNNKFSFWYYKKEVLIAVDAFNDPQSYMIGKRLIEEKKSPKKEDLENISFDIKNINY